MQTSLYICYFNTEEPLVHTQVLPYLRAVAHAGVRMHLLTYEKRSALRKSERERRRDIRQKLAADGIEWHTLKYHKRPSLLATSYDVLLGLLCSAWLLIRHRVNIFHARAHVPGVIALPFKVFLRRKLIFDFRGLMAEEYIDNGVWTAGTLRVRLVKSIERALLTHADRTILLTEKLKAELSGSGSITEASRLVVIPCCTDLTKYEPTGLERKNKVAGLTLVYVGSLMGRYMLREMIEFFKVLKAKRSGSRFLVLTRARRSDVEREFELQGVEPDSYSIITAEPGRVPELLSAGDLAISFVKPGPAVVGMSPTKIGEYLAAGLPVVSTRGGDTDTILQSEAVGVCVDGFSSADYESATNQMLALLDHAEVSERCRKVAQTYYSLADVGEPRYLAVYRSLAGSAGSESMSVDEAVVEARTRTEASMGQNA